MLEEALNLRQSALGSYHEDTMASLSALEDVLCFQKKYVEAEAAYRDVWARRSQAFGGNRPDTLNSLHMLGKALNDQEKYVEAECVFRDVFHVCDSIVSYDKISQNMHALAYICEIFD